MSASASFGRVLAAERQRAGLSQWALAERADLDDSMICRYECGTRHPSRSAVTALVAALGVEGERALALWNASGMVPTGCEMTGVRQIVRSAA